MGRPPDGPPGRARAARPPLSLKAKALQALAQREHSPLELERKLRQHARKLAQHAQQEAQPGSPPDDQGQAPATPAASLEAQVQEALQHAQSQGWLSPQRFIESRLRVRAARHGQRRIAQELAQHGLSLSPQQAQELAHTEAQRAHAVWARKFGQPPQSLAERARQVRFLAARGFSHEAIRQALGGGPDDGLLPPD